MQTPIGCLIVEADEQGLTKVMFVESPGEERPNDIVRRAVNQLAEYFDGKRTTFDLPMSAKGTEFRQKVWHALQTIPFGKTVCYSDIAEAMNNPKSVRAVGAANGANPISIIVPCHRVIGKDGSLTGYAGGLERKQWLLAFEK